MYTKVLGLGAPTSVQIALEAIEISALTVAIDDELARYADDEEGVVR